jgi:hypothetical protein
MTDSIKAYVLEGVDGEHCLVVRSQDVELLYSLVRRMSRMRDERLRQIGKALEGDLNDKC